MIELINVSKSYDAGRTFVVQNVNLTIETGEILVLLGSSGSGKTTLLKMINRLIRPSKGIVKIDGRRHSTIDSIQLRRSIGYVFQDVGLFPHMSIAENISIVPKLCGTPKKKRLADAEELLQFVNLDPTIYADRLPYELSGGQQQRVGVARALANNPSILLMDEPFGALDAVTRDALQHDLMQLNQGLKKTIVFVTHDIFEALRLADRIAVMHNGKIEQIDRKEILLTQPATDFVRDLFATSANQLAQINEQLSS